MSRLLENEKGWNALTRRKLGSRHIERELIHVVGGYWHQKVSSGCEVSVHSLSLLDLRMGRNHHGPKTPNRDQAMSFRQLSRRSGVEVEIAAAFISTTTTRTNKSKWISN